MHRFNSGTRPWGSICSTHRTTIPAPSRCRHTVLHVIPHSATSRPGIRRPTRASDLLVVGSGTGMAAALAAHELGLSVLVVEKASHVGGSTARSGGALWLPASPVLRGCRRRRHRGARRDLPRLGGRGIGAPAALDGILEPRVRDGRDAAAERLPCGSFGPATIPITTPSSPVAARPGAPANASRSTRRCSAPYRTRLEPGLMEAPVPIPTTGADYRWMNLVARVPRKGIPTFGKRLAQGVGGLVLGRRYAARRPGAGGRSVRGCAARRYPGVDGHVPAAPG